MTEFEMSSGGDSESGEESDSDAELQSAFEKGLLKPGLNEVIIRENRKAVNNVADMKMKLEEMKLKLAWIENMDLISNPAPMAPDVALQLQQTTQRRVNILNNNAKLSGVDISKDPVINEFQRETVLHRQAQASVIEGIRRLHEMGVVTKRPDTYFAEMAKTDTHMQKVRQNLMVKQAGQVRAEKVRQIRQQKKMGKQLQAQTKQERAKEKKEMLNQIKKYRKGFQGQDDFLNDNKGSGNKKSMLNKKSAARKDMKDKKFGFGGKKKGMKQNTRESSSDFGPSMKNKKGNFKHQGGSKQKNQRLGKSRRKSSKNKQ